MFGGAWQVSPWLSASVRQRVTTVDEEHTSDIVTKLAPTSALPKKYGGTCDALPADVKAALGLDGVLSLNAALRGIYDDA